MIDGHQRATRVQSDPECIPDPRTSLGPTTASASCRILRSGSAPIKKSCWWSETKEDGPRQLDRLTRREFTAPEVGSGESGPREVDGFSGSVR